MAGGLLNADGTPTALTRAVLAILVLAAFAASFALRTTRGPDSGSAAATAAGARPLAAAGLEAQDAAAVSTAGFALTAAPSLPDLRSEAPETIAEPPTLVEDVVPTPTPTLTPAPTVDPAPPAAAPPAPAPQAPPPKPPTEIFDSVG